MRYEKPEVQRQSVTGLMNHNSGIRVLCPEGTSWNGQICEDIFN